LCFRYAAGAFLLNGLLNSFALRFTLLRGKLLFPPATLSIRHLSMPHSVKALKSIIWLSYQRNNNNNNFELLKTYKIKSIKWYFNHALLLLPFDDVVVVVVVLSQSFPLLVFRITYFVEAESSLTNVCVCVCSRSAY